MRQVYVYMNDIRAGLLTEDAPGCGYTFVYDQQYLATDLPPISVRMPKRPEAYSSPALFPLFFNMLPEGGNRRAICRSAHLDEDDSFGLLIVMADKDFIGAVNVRNS